MGEPHASGCPDTPKCVGTMPGARLMSQMMTPQTAAVIAINTQSKIMVPVVRGMPFDHRKFLLIFQILNLMIFYVLSEGVDAFFVFGRRFALRSASVMIHCSWPLVLRNSSAAQASIAFIVSASTRRIKLFVSFFAIIPNYELFALVFHIWSKKHN